MTATDTTSAFCGRVASARSTAAEAPFPSSVALSQTTLNTGTVSRVPVAARVRLGDGVGVVAAAVRDGFADGRGDPGTPVVSGDPVQPETEPTTATSTSSAR